MILSLVRYGHGATSTLGRLSVNGVHACFVLEDEKRDVKVAGETRIPEGTYPVTLRVEGGFHAKYAKRFGEMHQGMLHIKNVPGFEFILIHTGNTEKETAGCLLVGHGAGIDSATGEFHVLRSEDAYRKLYPRVAGALVGGEPVTIEVRSK